MNETAIYSFLAETFRDVFGRDVTPTPDMTAADVSGWDSFAQISIIMATEEHFGIEFSTKELGSFKNVGTFVDVIKAKLPKTAE